MKLQTILFGHYQPPAIPGRFHTLNEQPNARNVTAQNRKKQQRAAPRREAIIRYMETVEWASVRKIAKAANTAHQYVQKVMAEGYELGEFERRVIAGSRSEFEYRMRAAK